jgi:glycerophosphoryl diester phosphodiesterase
MQDDAVAAAPQEGRMPALLVAHRGAPSSYPENSLIGFEAVLRAGAAYIETDVQLSADGVPLLCHDPDVVRVTGHHYTVMQTDYATLAGLCAGYPSRFGAQFADVRLARLEELAALLKRWRDSRALIEVKEESLQVFGTEQVMDRVLTALREVLGQCIIISFAQEPLIHSRQSSRLPVGWVLSDWSNATRAAALALQPDYLICNRKRLPAAPEPLWPGPWQWVTYTVNTVGEALALHRRGVALIESDVICRLLSDPTLIGDGRG